MATTAPPAARRGGRRGGGPRNAGGHRQSGEDAQHPASQSQHQGEDSDEARRLRAKFGDLQLPTVKELFPDWTDEDLLFALGEANGDLELAIARISDGHVEQFSSVKSKKTKKEAAPPPPAGNHHPDASAGASVPGAGRGRGGFAGVADRGGRGRSGGSLRGARGGRGGSASARGGAPRGGMTAYVNGHAPNTAASAYATAAVAPAAASDEVPLPATTDSKTPLSWADAVSEGKKKANPVPSPAAPVLAATEDESANAPAVTSAGDEASGTGDGGGTDNTAPADETPMPAVAPDVFAPAPSKPFSKTIPPGTKLSWAQVARPQEPPKPQPPAPKPPAPAPQASEAAPVEAQKPQVPTPQPQGVPAAEPAPPTSEVPEPAPTVVESEVPSAEAAQESVAVAREPAQAPTAAEPAAPEQPISSPPTSGGPPGLSAKPVNPSSVPAAAPASVTRPSFGARANQRSRQDAAVVMPGGGATIDRLGMQFGSLNFLGGGVDGFQADEIPAPVVVEPVEQAIEQKEEQPPVVPEPAPQQAVSSPAVPSQPSQSAFASRFPASQSSPVAAAQQQQQAQQPAPVQPHHQQDDYAAAPAANQAASASAYSNFYSNYQAPGQQAQASPSLQQQHQQPPQQQQHQVPHQQQQQHPEPQQQQPQPQQQHQQQQQQQRHDPSSYGAFSGLAQVQNQPGPFGSAHDYSALYGADSQRLMQGFYSSAYDQSGFPARTSLGQDNSTKQPSSQNAASTQPQQTHDQATQAGPGPQHPPGSAPAQQYPGVMPYYYPYYIPNQFQHYAQPAVGYGQFAASKFPYGLPGGPGAHSSKPGTPSALPSPYASNGPADASSYGGSHYGQSPQSAATTAYDQQQQSFGQQMQGIPGLGDYSKIYGGAIPGLQGFLQGQAAMPPAQGGNPPASAGGAASSGTPHLNAAQKTGAGAGAGALDASAYRGYDASKQPAAQGTGAPAGRAGGAAGGAQQGQGAQGQQGQQGQQQQQAQQQQQPAQNPVAAAAAAAAYNPYYSQYGQSAASAASQAGPANYGAAYGYPSQAYHPSQRGGYWGQ